MNETLMSIIVDAALFLELVSDEDLDPDVATECRENVAAILTQLSRSERAVFADYVGRRSDEHHDPGLAAVMRQLPQSLGLD